MPMRHQASGLIAIVLCGAAVALADPPPVACLLPRDFKPTAGQKIDLEFKADPTRAAADLAWPNVETVFVRAAREQADWHNVRPTDGQARTWSVPLAEANVNLVGLDQTPVVSTLTNAEWRAFVTDHLSAEAVPARFANAAQVRLRHIASQKLLLRVAPAAQPDDAPGATPVLRPSAIATSKTGLRADLRPLFDPTAAGIGSDIPLWFYADGIKCSGARVIATHRDSGQTATFTTGHGGNVCFHLSQPGVWIVQAAYVSEEAGPGADLTLYTATLTFATREGGVQ